MSTQLQPLPSPATVSSAAVTNSPSYGIYKLPTEPIPPQKTAGLDSLTSAVPHVTVVPSPNQPAVSTATTIAGFMRGNKVAPPHEPPKMTVPTTSPRAQFSLPTVPVSFANTAQLLPIQPLPQQPETMGPASIKHTTAAPSRNNAHHQQPQVTITPNPQPQSPVGVVQVSQAQPNLPMHPLPPTSDSDYARMALVLQPKPDSEVNHLSHPFQFNPQVKEQERLEAEKQRLQQQQQQERSFTELFHHYLSRGHPEHIAFELATKHTRGALPQKESRLMRQPPLHQTPPPCPSPVDATYNRARPPLDIFRLTDSPQQQQQQQPQPQEAHQYKPPSFHPHPLDMHTGGGAGSPFEFPNGPPFSISSSQGSELVKAHREPIAPPLSEFVLPNLEAHPVVWQGFLGLKTEFATVQFHYVSGCKDLARASLPTVIPQPEMAMPTLKIPQRMRLEEEHLSGVNRKMEQPMEHCVLMALPCGHNPKDVEVQSKHLRSHFITYLQLKSAAGIVNTPGSDQENSYVVHVFPSCDFANETMGRIAPDLLARVAEIEHMVIIITTTT